MGFFRKLFGKADLPATSDGYKLHAPLNGRAAPKMDLFSHISALNYDFFPYIIYM